MSAGDYPLPFSPPTASTRPLGIERGKKASFHRPNLKKKLLSHLAELL
jgi:hypothetical protein